MSQKRVFSNNCNVVSKKRKSNDNSTVKDQNLLQCYASAGTNVMIMKRSNKNPSEFPIKNISDEIFALESYPTAKTILTLMHMPNKDDKLTWVVMMVTDNSFFQKPDHWKHLNGVYFKFRLEGKIRLARLIREGDTNTLQKAFSFFYKKYTPFCTKFVDNNACIAVVNKPVELLRGLESEFLLNKISCFESNKWIENLKQRKEVSQSKFVSNKDSDLPNNGECETNEIQYIETLKSDASNVSKPKKCSSLTGGLIIPMLKSTPMKHSQVKPNRQPIKSMFFDKINRSPDEIIKSVEDNEKDFLFVQQNCSSLVMTLDKTDIKKTLFENMLKLIEIQSDNVKMVTRILKKDQVMYMEVPDNDKSSINENTVIIEGVFELPIKKYREAISERDASKIVSHLVRKCFPEEYWNCYLVNKDKKLQLNWVIGNPNLEENERIEDGDRKILALIVHAYRQVGKKYFTYSEVREGRREISQGLSDLRTALKLKRAKQDADNENKTSTNEEIIAEDDNERNDGADSATDNEEDNDDVDEDSDSKTGNTDDDDDDDENLSDDHENSFVNLYAEIKSEPKSSSDEEEEQDER